VTKATAYECVIVERHAEFVTIWMNRPERRNALSPDVIEGLLDGLERAAADDAVRTVVLTGAGDRAFCAGADLSAMGAIEGRIAEHAAGSEGFGYDPIFVPDGEDRTVAELGNEWKALNSHRARAARALLEALAAGY